MEGDGVAMVHVCFVAPPPHLKVLIPVSLPRLRHCVGFAASALCVASANPEPRRHCEVASRWDDATSDSRRGGRGYGELLSRLPLARSPSRRSDQHILARQRPGRARGEQGAVGVYARVPPPRERAVCVCERAQRAPWLPAPNRWGKPEVDKTVMVRVCPET